MHWQACAPDVAGLFLYGLASLASLSLLFLCPCVAIASSFSPAFSASASLPSFLLSSPVSASLSSVMPESAATT